MGFIVIVAIVVIVFRIAAWMRRRDDADRKSRYTSGSGDSSGGWNGSDGGGGHGGGHSGCGSSCGSSCGGGCGGE
ncbi:hypothetical protein ACGF0D_42040 [Kitasatospora sp. NPDC048298]|uniref:hypothetical protein n=1 Tax=Kitasatospora sp. NPDC048298 TaxID=3364049 RepID=UPI00371854F3